MSRPTDLLCDGLKTRWIDRPGSRPTLRHVRKVLAFEVRSRPTTIAEGGYD